MNIYIYIHIYVYDNTQSRWRIVWATCAINLMEMYLVIPSRPLAVDTDGCSSSKNNIVDDLTSKRRKLNVLLILQNSIIMNALIGVIILT